MRAGREQWIVLTKDTKIRRRLAELDAIRRGRLRVFCITTANLTGEQQRDRILVNMKHFAALASARPNDLGYIRGSSGTDLAELIVRDGRGAEDVLRQKPGACAPGLRGSYRLSSCFLGHAHSRASPWVGGRRRCRLERGH